MGIFVDFFCVLVCLFVCVGVCGMGGRRNGRVVGGLWAAHRKQVFEKKMFANGAYRLTWVRARM